MGTAYICLRCSLELRPGDEAAFVRAMATARTPDRLDLELPEDADLAQEWADLMAELDGASAREAEDQNCVTQVMPLCRQCVDTWSWQRLRQLHSSRCAQCELLLPSPEHEQYRAGFVTVTLQLSEVNAIGADGLVRVEIARRALSRELQGLADLTHSVGPDDMVIFSLCCGCKSRWAEEPLDDRDWP